MTETALTTRVDQLVGQVARAVEQRNCHIAVAESLTGGQLAAALSSAPNAGEWFLGGITAYHPEVKYNLLRAPRGPVVTPETAEAMARSTADLLEADYSVALTGVGGPEPDEHKPAGTVYLATFGTRRGPMVEGHLFSGNPLDVLAQSIEAALKALIARLESDSGEPSQRTH